MRCTKCHHDIDPIRLEVLPETTICKTCAKSREPAQVPVVRPLALDPQPYIDAQIPYAQQNHKSFVVKKPKKKKTSTTTSTPKYTQIGGLTSTDKRKGNQRATHNTKVSVEFRSQGKVHTYQYRIKTFRDTFKVNPHDIHTAVAVGYTFYVEGGILYLDRKGKKPNVRIGKYTKRKAK